jgi:hypothetical protein
VCVNLKQFEYCHSEVGILDRAGLSKVGRLLLELLVN